jgi:2-polyprenyl-6-methoxyphenol hydroxylase-like FAD-dependent oxidoreductase
MTADVIIVGGGPAGMMAGLLFARAGIETLVLEKHGDFLRDFRGDTVHPSTMEILSELGMLGRFLQRPFSKVSQARLTIAGKTLTVGELSHLNTPAPFIAMMPQWEFLDFLKTEAAAYPAFRLEMEHDVAKIDEVGGRVTGVTLANGQSITANKLVIAADGSSSLVRSADLLPLTELGAPIDVFWFSVPKIDDGGDVLRGIVQTGSMMVLIDRNDYWQCAFIFPKGRADALRKEGVEAMCVRVEAVAPNLTPLGSVLTSMDQFHLLSVKLDRLDRWHRPGLLAIGDAAHAMSPIGGIGINLAIQDAVAATGGLNQCRSFARAGREAAHSTNADHSGRSADRTGQFHQRGVQARRETDARALADPSAQPVSAAAPLAWPNHWPGRAARACQFTTGLSPV